MNKKRNKLFFGALTLLGILLAFLVLNVNVSAVGEAVVCCEQTNSGAWCQEVTDSDQCDDGYRSAPTSCESTSYCKVGTCVNSLDGLCMENTPQKVCENPVGGVVVGKWYEQEIENVPQCQLGCCLAGDQAAFTTQARCKQISSDFGLETNYRTDIKTESQCINSASPQIRGACVFEEEAQRTCRLVTKQECNNLENSGVDNIEFHPGFLCSNEELGTNCGPSKKTMLVDGRDEVFFQDTCGNPANIYDSTRQDDLEYWNEIISKGQSCTLNSGLTNTNSCGNCNYLLGSIGKRYERAFGTAPVYGDFICQDLSCGEVDEEERDHGESWCVSSAGTDELDELSFAPGARHFRKTCYNSEVTLEPCADFRAERCIESAIDTNNGPFSTASCRPNMWQDCTAQDNSRDCLNTDRRDCKWIPGDRFDGQDLDDKERDGKCVPQYSPGFNFWEEGDAQTLCALGNNNKIVKFEKGIGGSLGKITESIRLPGLVEPGTYDYTCADNCDFLGLEKGDKLSDKDLVNDKTEGWNNLCISLGDCGIYTNFIDEEGYNRWEEVIDESKVDDKEDKSSGGLLG